MAAVMQYIWAAVLLILWSGFIILAGSDMGIGVLQPFAKPKERVTYMQAIGPMWGGNQVWFVTAGGATFAAFPAWYATLFSGNVIPLMLLVTLLVLRAVAIDWAGRSSGKSQAWMAFWSKVHAITAGLALAVIGAVFAALVHGMELAVVNPATLARAQASGFDAFKPPSSQVPGFVHYNVGGPFQPFSWYSVFGALAVLVPLIAQGAYFLAMRSRGKVQVARKTVVGVAIAGMVFAVTWMLLGHLFFKLNIILVGVAVVVFIVFTLLAIVLSGQGRRFGAWVSNSVALVMLPLVGLYGHFPYLISSTVNKVFSLTLPNSASSTPTLIFMSLVGLFVIPLVLAYTIWGYWLTRSIADPAQLRRSLPFDEVLMK